MWFVCISSKSFQNDVIKNTYFCFYQIVIIKNNTLQTGKWSLSLCNLGEAEQTKQWEF